MRPPLDATLTAESLPPATARFFSSSETELFVRFKAFKLEIPPVDLTVAPDSMSRLLNPDSL